MYPKWYYHVYGIKYSYPIQDILKQTYLTRYVPQMIQPVIWYQVFLSNTSHFKTSIWHVCTLGGTTSYMVSSIPIQYKSF